MLILCLIVLGSMMAIVPVFAETTTTVPAVNVVPLRSYAYGPLTDIIGRAIYVATNGSDVRGNGSEEFPYASAGAASMHARPGDVIVLKSGTYSIFGALRNSGTAERPIIVRPEPNGRVVYVLKKPYAALEIAGSHIRLFGIEVRQERDRFPGSCVLFTRHVSDVSLRDLKLIGCETGIRLSQPGASGSQVLIEDVSIVQAGQGIVCESCKDVVIRRAHLESLSRSGGMGTGFLFGATTTGVVLEDSEIKDSAADGVVSESADIFVSNSAIHGLAGSPVRFSNGGTVNNCDARNNGEAPVLRGGGTYRWRGTITEYEQTDTNGFGFRVEYDQKNSDRLTTLLLDANRFVIHRGGLGLPSVRENASAPLLITMRSNTFFFLNPTSFATLPDGQRVGTLDVASVSGTGIVNLGGNTSVNTAPVSDDLLSPVYVGGESRSLPLGLLLFPGTRIKGSGPTVYLYANDGKRHTFPDERVYRSWFGGYDGIISLSDDALAALPLGKNVTYRPGVRLVKLTTDPKVYAVDSDGFLRWVQTEEIAKELYGPQWSKTVEDVLDISFMDYRMGAPITQASDFRPDRERAEITNPSELF